MLNLSHVVFSGVPPRIRTASVRRVGSAARARVSPPVVPAVAPDPLVSWILERVGIDPAAYRTSFAARRGAACLRRLHVRDEAEARELLLRRPELLPLALNAVLIGISEFFRDASVFERLRIEVLPHLLDRHATVHVLGAGVSSGMELYSIAMLLDELGALRRANLVGIDCRPDAISQARSGIYDERDLAGVGAGRRTRYFTAQNGRLTVVPELRERIVWECADLLSLRPAETYQLILFRNVGIYLRSDAAIRVWTSLCAQLAPGGILFTGKGERPPATLPLCRVGPALYRRT